MELCCSICYIVLQTKGGKEELANANEGKKKGDP